MIGTCQCLVVGEDSLASMTDHHTMSGLGGTRRPELPPEHFCNTVFHLIALQVLVLGKTFTLEQRLQLTEFPAGGASRHNLLTHDKGESLLLNLLLPLCLRVGSGKKDTPAMTRSDIQFSLNLLLNLINPSTCAKSGPSAGGHGSGKDGRPHAPAHVAAVQYNPAGDVRTKVKSTSLEIAFLGIKILIVCFESQLNTEWFRIARVIRDMGNRSSEGNGPLWRFLDFMAFNRCTLYTLLLPFIHTRLQISADDSDLERHFQQATKDKMSGNVMSGGRSKTMMLKDLGKELGELRDGLNRRMQGTSSSIIHRFQDAI